MPSVTSSPCNWWTLITLLELLRQFVSSGQFQHVCSQTLSMLYRHNFRPFPMLHTDNKTPLLLYGDLLMGAVHRQGHSVGLTCVCQADSNSTVRQSDCCLSLLCITQQMLRVLPLSTLACKRSLSLSLPLSLPLPVPASAFCLWLRRPLANASDMRLIHWICRCWVP